MKTVTLRRLASAGAFSIVLGQASAGPLDPDCTAEKAAKSAAMKATVGVGGRCSPKGGRRRHRKARHWDRGQGADRDAARRRQGAYGQGQG